MIRPELYAQILLLHQTEKWLPNTIARQLKVHHTTVRRVLAQAGFPPHAKLARPSKVDPYVPMIVQSLERWPTLTASRLIAMARERGYSGGASQFRARVAMLRPRPPAQAYLRLRTLPGEQAQVDWAHFGRITIGRAERALMGFVMVLSYSRALWLRFYPDARMSSFLAGHESCFEALGGVARVVLYDNLKSAVLERYHDAIRFNPTLIAFAQHYRFEPRPVSPARGNEKGRVERAIRYIRTAFFAGREFRDLDDLNAQAAIWCATIARTRPCPEDTARSVAQVFAQEQPRLLPLPPDRFDRHERIEVRIGKTPYARFDLNDYSVPHDRVSRTLSLLATTEFIRLFEGQTLVAEHRRSYDRGAQIEDPAHIAALLERKRAARRHATSQALIVAIPAIGELLKAAAERGHNIGAIVIALDRMSRQYSAAEIASAVQQAIARGVPHHNAVRLMLEQSRQKRRLPPVSPVTLPEHLSQRDVVIAPHNLDAYDRLQDCDDDAA